MLAKGYEDAKYGYSWFLLRHATSYMGLFQPRFQQTWERGFLSFWKRGCWWSWSAFSTLALPKLYYTGCGFFIISNGFLKQNNPLFSCLDLKLNNFSILPFFSQDFLSFLNRGYRWSQKFHRALGQTCNTVYIHFNQLKLEFSLSLF